MIREVQDAETLNFFAQHPDIAPAIGGPLDLTNAVRETAVFMFGEHGGFIFEWCAPGTYEVHAMLTEAGRGPWGFDAARKTLELMAERGASHIWGRIASPHVALFARKAGFRDAGWQTLYDEGQPKCWRIMDWRPKCPQP